MKYSKELEQLNIPNIKITGLPEGREIEDSAYGLILAYFPVGDKPQPKEQTQVVLALNGSSDDLHVLGIRTIMGLQEALKCSCFDLNILTEAKHDLAPKKDSRGLFRRIFDIFS